MKKNNKEDRDFRKQKCGDYENFVQRARTGSTRSVHFSATDLPNESENLEMANKLSSTREQPANYFHLVISIFSLFIGSVAIAGCILLYLELNEINIEVKNQKNQIFGNENSASKNSLQISPQQGWLYYFKNRFITMDRRIDDVKKWINTSACIDGHDFTTNDYCFRLVNFKVTFDQAEDFCKKRNGLLGFADNENVWNKTINFLVNRGFMKQEIWTGLRKNQFGVWKYVNGRRATFARWAKGNLFDSGDHCAKIRIGKEGSAMYDCRCTDNDPEPRAFLCRFFVG